MSDIAIQRENMVESQIRTADVTDRRVIAAFQALPREKFVPASRRSLAYMGESIEIRARDRELPARHLMAPMPLARMLQLAELEASDVVLDIGCGTGYSACLIASIAESVVGVEVAADLVEFATNHASELGINNVAFVENDLAKGYPDDAPYDVIVMNGSVPEAPEALFDQLNEGGRLVSFISNITLGRAVLFTKTNGIVSRTESFDAAVPALPGFERAPGFVF